MNRTLPKQEQATIEAHLAECAACRAEVDVWTGLRHSMQEVSAGTPRPRADMFARIEHQLDVSPGDALKSRLDALLRVCWLALTVCGEHVRAQARLIRRDLFLMPLLLLPLAGWMVYLYQSGDSVPDTAALLAVLITALGKAFLYGQEADPPREMVLVTPTSPRLVLGVRCCLVFGYDLLINCGLILPFLVWQGVITPGWFLESWLFPIFCLSAAALLFSIVFNSGMAVLICIFLWVLRMLDHVPVLPALPWLQHYENFWHQGPLLVIIGLLSVLLAFSSLERKECFA